MIVKSKVRDYNWFYNILILICYIQMLTIFIFYQCISSPMNFIIFFIEHHWNVPINVYVLLYLYTATIEKSINIMVPLITPLVS